MTLTKRFIIFLCLFFVTGISSAFAQKIEVSGRITDKEKLEMPGVSIMVKGTTIGVTSDIDGNYKISVPSKKSILVFSFLSFKTKEVVVGDNTVIDVVLEEDSQVLGEAVVVGMSTQTRNTITSAISVVKSDAIETRPVTDLTSALQGNVAGLNFATDATEGGVGGEAGAEIKFNIRGVGSINGGEPYVIVDGVEQSMQNVNPADIESISVLKDASASAVYGARAAYGVVIVTTKSGKKDQTRINYKGTVGFSSPINLPKMMNSLEFAAYSNQRDLNEGKQPRFTESAIQRIKGFMEHPYTPDFPGVLPNQSGQYWAGGQYVQFGNTDWYDYYFRDRALQQSHNLSIQGGGEKVTYYVGMGYTYQQGLIDRVNDDLSKYNMNMKFTMKANDWLSFNLNNNITLTSIRRPLVNQTIFYNSVSNTVPTSVAWLPVDNEEYAIPNWNELYYMRKSSYIQNRISDAMTFAAIFKPMEGLNITAEMKARLDVENNSFTLKKPSYMRPDGVIEETSGVRQGYQYPGMHWKNTKFGSITRGNAFNYYLSPNISASYTKQAGDHFVKAMAGFQSELQRDLSTFLYKDGVLSEDTYSFSNADGATYQGEYYTHWSTRGFYTKFNYNYKNVYFFEFSGRYDGSSRFAPGHRWGLFPSFSLGYDMARTDYFTRLNLPVSQLKVRLSYGRLGNQNGAGLYDYIGLMRLNPNSVDAWLLPGSSGEIKKGTIAQTPKMVSPYITWEKVDNANLGLDLMMFKDRLSFTLELYERNTRDMIGPAEAIPDISGISPDERAKVNNATLRNRGWELSVNWRDSFKNGFSYGIGLNLFDYKAVITKYNNPEGILYNNHTGLTRNKGYYEGMDIGEIWGYQADDLFKSNQEINSYLEHVDLSFFKLDDKWQVGDLKYLDTNRDGKVNPGKGTLSDHGDLKIIGNATPRYSFGINLNVGYKGFNISTLLQGVGKRDFPLAGSTYLFGGRNYFKDHLDYFSYENPDGYLPRLIESKSQDFKVNTSYNTTRYLMNAAYLRMKNLTVSYSFDKKILKYLHLGSMRMYFTCDNIFTIDALPSAFDPETINIVNTWAGGSNEVAPGLTSPANENGNGKVYPLNRNFVFGVELSF